jgi:hypothetical protein
MMRRVRPWLIALGVVVLLGAGAHVLRVGSGDAQSTPSSLPGHVSRIPPVPVVATAARTSDVAVYLARLGRGDRRTTARRERAPDQGARWRLVADRLPTDREVTHR